MEFFAGDIALEDDSEALYILENNLMKVKSSSKTYCGYKQPALGTIHREDIPSFILLKKDYGIILIDIVDKQLSSIDEEFWLYNDGSEGPSRDIVLDNFEIEVDNRLKDSPLLFDRRTKQKKINLKKVLIFMKNSRETVSQFSEEILNDCIYFEELDSKLEEFILSDSIGFELEDKTWDKLISVLDGSHFYEKSSRRKEEPTLETKRDFIEAAINKTFALDLIQKKIAQQIPQGPQRIRGLAGTGKTVILAMKAALAHKTRSDFNILYAFHTQSLYQIIREYVEKYYIPEAKRAVDYSKLHVLHSWGGKTTQAGVYSTLCMKYGHNPLSWAEARQRSSEPVEYIFRELLRDIGDKLEPVYDLVLIDEAQDLPPAFFETIYKITKDPKRIVWAYDEFQTLSDLRIKGPEEMFGVDRTGKPNLKNSVLEGQYPGYIEKDFILPISYRNPRLNLVVAHGLGLGLNSSEGIVNIVEDKRSWEAIGYTVVYPENKDSYVEGDKVTISRNKETSKNILEDLLLRKAKSQNSKTIQRTVLPVTLIPQTFAEEVAIVVNEIDSLIRVEGISPEEIMVITLSRSQAGEKLKFLRKELDKVKVQSIIPGIIEKPSLFKADNCVTLTTPYRAKGNESHVVFVMNCETLYSDTTFRTRSSIFVSITRSLGWCFLTGVGSGFEKLKNEYNNLTADYPQVTFYYPSQDVLDRRRVILSKMGDDLESEERLVDSVISQNEDLLIEALMNRPDLLKKLGKKKTE